MSLDTCLTTFVRWPRKVRVREHEIFNAQVVAFREFVQRIFLDFMCDFKQNRRGPPIDSKFCFGFLDEKFWISEIGHCTNMFGIWRLLQRHETCAVFLDIVGVKINFTLKMTFWIQADLWRSNYSMPSKLSSAKLVTRPIYIRWQVLRKIVGAHPLTQNFEIQISQKVLVQFKN